jgi:magnesium transporter
MKRPVVPSAELLRFLKHQTETAFPFHTSRPRSATSSTSARRISNPSRRYLSSSARQCAKPQTSFIDDLWPRHRETCQALPPPRTHPPPSPSPRHASNSAHPGWLHRIFRHRQAISKAAESNRRNGQTGASQGNQPYEDTSAQLFNLSRTLSRASPGADLKLRCTEFDANGSVTLVAGEFKKSELIAKFGLLPRDLRKIDSSIIPHILVRPSAILINLLNLRVLIQSDRVLVFDAYGSTDTYNQSLFMYDLEGKLRQKADPRNPSNNLPYEFRALEAILISVTSGLEAEHALVSEPVTHILRELEEDIDREKLRHLLIHSKKLGTFEQKARLVRDAIDDVLNADDDLSAMYLTERKKTGKPRDETNHQEVEMLLESYHKICDEIVEMSGNLISNIRNTEEVVKAILDANRNQLMLLDLRFSIATVGIGGGTLVAGLYGMNLENFIEETNWGFGAVTATCFALTGLISWFGVRRLRKIQKVRMWGEGIDGLGREGGRIGLANRGNWMNEAMESQAAHASRMNYARSSIGSAGPVLWPGMEGLGIHKLQHTEFGDHTAHESQSHAEQAKARCETIVEGSHRGTQRPGQAHVPSLTIHDDIEDPHSRMADGVALVKAKGGVKDGVKGTTR